MKVSLNWLKEFVDVAAEPRQLKADLIRVGLNAESFAAVADDFVFEIEVTTNRPDCLSHYGVAREVASLYRKSLKGPKVVVKESSAAAASEISIDITDPDLCARYCGRVIRNVQVEPSPAWLAKRLEAVGMRPINNVADVTNYVLMELGQPLHAFDLARLSLKKIIVRRANRGEPLLTLDGINRTLKPEHLVIADAQRAVALAGIMGGRDSEISSTTSDVMLESAWFDPISVRRTAKAQGLHTEASHRFERGADIEMAPRALDRAAALIAELAGGEVLAGVVDVYPRPQRRPKIRLRASEGRRILGTEVPYAVVERILTSLGFKLRRHGVGSLGSWRVIPPSFRLDVAIEADLIEEIARHYGYDRLPSRVRPGPPRVDRDTTRDKVLAVSSLLVGLGYREVITTSMVDPEENARFTDRPPVVLGNPLSQEASALRSSPVPSMLRVLRWNLDRDQGDLRLFEFGKTYAASPKTSEGLPTERRVLTLGLTGHRRSASIHDSARELDFFDLKGDLEVLFNAFHLSDLRFDPIGCHYYEPGLAGRFVAGGETLALFGRLSGPLARDYKLRQPTWLAEIDFDGLLGCSLRSPAFHAFSRFPAVERDFSLVVPQGVRYKQLEERLAEMHLEEMQGFRPADLFAGGAIPSGHYSLLLRVTFQNQTRTLTNEDIGELSRKVLETLGSLGVRLRS